MRLVQRELPAAEPYNPVSKRGIAAVQVFCHLRNIVLDRPRQTTAQHKIGYSAFKEMRGIVDEIGISEKVELQFGAEGMIPVMTGRLSSTATSIIPAVIGIERITH